MSRERSTITAMLDEAPLHSRQMRGGLFMVIRGPDRGATIDLPFKIAKNQLVDAFERDYVEALVARHKNNLSAASREAQIDRKHLRELMHKHGIGVRGLGSD